MTKKILYAVCRIAPGLISRFVYYKMTHPKLHKLRPQEIRILNDAQKEVLRIEGFSIQTYKWPGGSKKILLVHGWEGQAGNFSQLVPMLLSQGYTVYAFDGPSHGQSSRKPVTFFDFSRVVATLLQMFKIRLVVCHSFGSVATIYALHLNQNIVIDRLVLITTPNRLMEFLEDQKSKFNLSETVCKKVVRRIQRKTGYDLPKLAVQNFVPLVQVQNAILIHDKADAVIPIERSRTVYRHWPACQLMEVEGTGHFKILRSPEVLNSLLSFLNKEVDSKETVE